MANLARSDLEPLERHGWRAHLVALGRLRSVLALTAFSIITSVVLTRIGLGMLDVPPEGLWQGYVLSVVVPGLVAPMATYAITGLVFELEEARRQIHQLAIRDGLTQAYNRAHLLDQLPREVQRSQRSGQPLSVLMLDADHFKRINDAHGHAGGDTVLVKLAETCRDVLRPYDLLVRFGGEEFVLLLIGIGIDQAGEVAQGLRTAIAALQISTHDTDRVTVTVSIGIAELFDADTDGTELLERADQALYRAKKAGRNCCVTWSA